MFQDRADHSSISNDDRGEASPAFTSLVDRGQALAALLACKRFSLAVASQREGGVVLLPYMDSSYPGLSSLSHMLAAAMHADNLVEAARSAAPTIFGIADASVPAGSRTHRTPLVTGEIVAAFPVHSPCGRRGLVAVAGPAPSLDETDLMRAHLQAFALFRAACALRMPAPVPRSNLTKRDIECLRLTADGLTSEQLGERLGLSVHTANQYVSAVVEKLDAVNRLHAVAKALRAGIIS